MQTTYAAIAARMPILNTEPTNPAELEAFRLARIEAQNEASALTAAVVRLRRSGALDAVVIASQDPEVAALHRQVTYSHLCITSLEHSWETGEISYAELVHARNLLTGPGSAKWYYAEAVEGAREDRIRQEAGLLLPKFQRSTAE